MTKIDKIIRECIDENVFGEDEIVEAKVILTWLFKGRRKAEEISKTIVKNLINCGFANEEKLIGDMEEGLWFSLAIAGAKGYIEQQVTP